MAIALARNLKICEIIDTQLFGLEGHSVFLDRDKSREGCGRLAILTGEPIQHGRRS